MSISGIGVTVFTAHNGRLCALADMVSLAVEKRPGSSTQNQVISKRFYEISQHQPLQEPCSQRRTLPVGQEVKLKSAVTFDV